MQKAKTSEEIKVQLNLETAQIAWSELQIFFASGKAIFVDASQDMIDIAAAIHADDAVKVRALMDQNLVGQVSDQQAALWCDQNASVWAVVVRPWVLVQEGQ